MPKQKILFIIVILIFNNILSSKAHDSPQRKQLFDYNWKFFLGDTPAARTIGFDDKSWRTLDLPHDWSIEGTLDTNNPMGNDGGYFPALSLLFWK